MPENVESRKLSDLRVVDLRNELEKRGLDKGGNKQVLIERLQKVMKEEGLDPNTYDFDGEKKSIKQTPDSCQDNDKPVVKEEATLVVKEESQKNEEGKCRKSDTSVESDNFLQLILGDEENLQDEVDADNESTTNKGPVKKETIKGESTAETKDQNVAKVVPQESEKGDNKKSLGMRAKIRQSRNLWITNITKATRAAELKQLLSAHGKVIGAKVVINAKHPGTCCYGYVTMESVKDADNCIAQLNNSELSGRVIKIEKERPDFSSYEKLKNRLHTSKHKAGTKDNKTENANEIGNDDKKEEVEGQLEDPSSKQPDSTSRKSRSRDPSRQGSVSNSLKKEFSLLTYEQIKEKQERQRYQKRLLQEEYRLRREEAERRREIDKMEHAKIAHIERERDKLDHEKERLRADKQKFRYEKEKLDREKDRILKLERDIHLEKLELEREKTRFQEERRAFKRSAEFRRSNSFNDRKRMTNDRHFEDGSSQMRFESHGRYNEHDHGHEHGAIFVPMRDERTRPMPEIKDDPRTAARFIDPPSQETQRFERNPGANSTWSHPKSVSVRTFGNDSWRPPTPHRWNAGTVSHVASSSSSGSFAPNSNVNVGGPPCPPPPVINNYGAARFEYKPSASMRKY